MFRILSLGLATCLAGEAFGATVVVNDLSPAPALGVWTIETTGTSGAGSIVNLAGLGGNLENNQPLPTGAVKLTTGADANDRANVFLRQDFGSASLLANATLGYSYYKENVGQPAPAPAMKIELLSTGTGDNFGTLIYEPYLNPLGNPPTGDWQDVSISGATGGGATATDGWWWSGGFEIGNSGGGQPYRSLAEWVAAFQLSDPVDFANARIVGVGVGMGSNNLNQVGYFDNVRIGLTPPGTTGIAPTVYDFELAVMPEPATALLLAFGAAGLVSRRRRASVHR